MGGIVEAVFGGGPDVPDTPPVVQSDPKADQAKIEAEATSKANAESATRRKNQRANSLLSTGAGGVTDTAQTSSVLAYGKDKLGA